MALLGKRKAATDYGSAGHTSSRKQIKTQHAAHQRSSPRILTTTAHDSDKENISTRSKRKRGSLEEAACAEPVDNEIQQTVTPQRKRACKVMPLSPMETPSRRTARLFDRLDLRTAGTTRVDYSTPPDTPTKDLDHFADVLPAQLLDHISLHSAFLSTMHSLMALDSSAFRLSAQEIVSATTNNWRKRAVTLEDIRRVIAATELGWALEDFGRAGISLVRQCTMARSISILDSHKMKHDFEVQLRRHFTKWRQECQENRGCPDDFIAQLPLAPITRSDSLEKMQESRGKARLHSIKDAQAAAVAQPPTTTSKNVAASTQTRSSSLLDRVLAKQAVNAALPAGPSRAQLERKSSLQRVEEVARILDVLSSGRARASFSMQSVVQQIQQSLRSPLSRVEIERCLSIMATEVMPQFVSIIASGSVIGVVITIAGKLGFADLKKVLADTDV